MRIHAFESRSGSDVYQDRKIRSPRRFDSRNLSSRTHMARFFKTEKVRQRTNVIDTEKMFCLKTGPTFVKIYCCHLNFMKSRQLASLQCPIHKLFIVIIGPGKTICNIQLVFPAESIFSSDNSSSSKINCPKSNVITVKLSFSYIRPALMNYFSDMETQRKNWQDLIAFLQSFSKHSENKIAAFCT